MLGNVNFSVLNKTRRKVPRVPFLKIKEAVLGKQYELSLVFIGGALSRSLNKKYRGKDKSTDVLSFPLSKTSGEIFIDLSSLHGHSVGFLFIHGLLHLNGMLHGSRMESEENKLLKKFKLVHGTAIYHGHRHRHLSS